MKSKLESAYAKALTGTFKVINPIKKTIKKTNIKKNNYNPKYKLIEIMKRKKLN